MSEEAVRPRSRRERRRKGRTISGPFKTGPRGNLIPIRRRKGSEAPRAKTLLEASRVVGPANVAVIEAGARTTTWGVYCSPCDRLWTRDDHDDLLTRATAENICRGHFRWHLDELVGEATT